MASARTYDREQVSARHGTFETLDVRTLTGLSSPLPVAPDRIDARTLAVRESASFACAASFAGAVDVRGALSADALTLAHALRADAVHADTLEAAHGLAAGSAAVAGDAAVRGALVANGSLRVGGAATFVGPVFAGELRANEASLGATRAAALDVVGHAALTTIAATSLAATGAVSADAVRTRTLAVGAGAHIVGHVAVDTLTATERVSTSVLATTHLSADALVVPGSATMTGSVQLGATTAASLAARGAVSATRGDFGALTATALAMLTGGAQLGRGAALVVDNASIRGSGSATMTLAGDITTTGGAVVAPRASLGEIADVTRINGLPYPPPGVGMPLDAAFRDLTVRQTLVANGTATLGALNVPFGDVVVTKDVRVGGGLRARDAAIVGAVAAAQADIGGTATCATLIAATAAIAALEGVRTINGAPVSGTRGSDAGVCGAAVEVPPGCAWPALFLPAGKGEFVITPATLAGLASNAPQPAGEAGDYLDTAPRVLSLVGPGAADALNVRVTNATPFVLALPLARFEHLPASAGQAWLPGTAARFTRASAASVWAAETAPLCAVCCDRAGASVSCATARAELVSYMHEVRGASRVDAGFLDLCVRGRAVVRLAADTARDNAVAVTIALPRDAAPWLGPVDACAAAAAGLVAPVLVGTALFCDDAGGAATAHTVYADGARCARLRVYAPPVGGVLCVDFAFSLPRYAPRAEFK